MNPEQAILSDIMPSNPIPFCNRIIELVKQGKSIDSIEVKSCLWILNAIVYGQLAVIDLPEEYNQLYRDLKHE